MTNYIIGIDGGATKTLGVLFDLSGNELRRTEQGFANFRVDKETTKQHLIATLDALTVDIDCKDLAYVQIGVAGVPEAAYREAVIAELTARYIAPVNIATDAEVALYSIRKNSDDCVIMVLGGTGSAVMVRDRDKDTLIGGFGHLLGDEGSGYHLAITALRQIIGQYEEKRPITPLSQAILNRIGAKNHFDIKDFVYNSSKQQIAELSSFIATFAKQGDDEAIRLFQEEGKHLARQTMLAFERLDSCRQVTIGFRGSFLLQAPYVKETMLAQLDTYRVRYNVDNHPQEPVVGAYHLAMHRWKEKVRS